MYDLKEIIECSVKVRETEKELEELKKQKEKLIKELEKLDDNIKAKLFKIRVNKKLICKMMEK